MLFKSQTKRNMILAICFGIGIDVIVSYLIGTYVDTGFSPIIVAIGLPVGVYVTAWGYSIYIGLKELAWFILFERKGRIDAIHSLMLEYNFPTPESEYDNADDYFTKVSLLNELPARTALAA